MHTLNWWPEPDTPEEWHWAEETMKTIRNVARRKRFELYGRDGYQEAAADLESWLIQEAIVFREKYVPPNPDDTASEALDRWCRVLHTVLRNHAEWHFTRLYRQGSLTGADLRWQVLTTDRLDRKLTEDGEQTLADHAKALWPHSEIFYNPEHQHIRREVLEELLLAQFGIIVRDATLEVLLNELEKVAGKQPRRPGQCGEFGCMNDARLKGLCSHHHKRYLIEDAPRCSTDGCTKAVVRGGRCSTHQPPCDTLGCDRTDNIVRGLCPSHYNRWLAAQPKPQCTIDGCDRPVKARGICSVHYHQWRAANAEPCTIDNCHKPAMCRGLCPKHYQRAMRPGAGKAS